MIDGRFQFEIVFILESVGVHKAPVCLGPNTSGRLQVMSSQLLRLCLINIQNLSDFKAL